MSQIKVIIEDTSGKDGVFPTVTPWWEKGRCLLLGCSNNKDLKCNGISCKFELPEPIDCRFYLKEDE